MRFVAGITVFPFCNGHYVTIVKKLDTRSQAFHNARYEWQLVMTMGRKRTFNVEQALDAALSVFWRKGYEGTSYADLVAATGLERPSLYSAFGNKEALFLRALTRYTEHYADYVSKALELAT